MVLCISAAARRSHTLSKRRYRPIITAPGLPGHLPDERNADKIAAAEPASSRGKSGRGTVAECLKGTRLVSSVLQRSNS